MPRARGLDLSTFWRAVAPALLERYFAASAIQDALARWFHVNSDAFAAFAADEANAEVTEPVLEDFESIDQLCRDGSGLVLRAYHRFGLHIDEFATPHDLAMMLFLDHPEVFQYARSHYLLFGGGATLSVFQISSEDVTTGDEQITAFSTDVQKWFHRQAKGEHVRVHCYRDREEVIILVQRGALLETRPIWEGSDIVVSTQRPAAEDVLVYDPRSSQLRLRSALQRDRIEYLRLFALHMGKDERLAERALQEEVFSLEPVRTNSFNYRGKGPIKRVELVGVKLKLHGVANTMLQLRAEEIREALKHDLKGVTLKSGDLLAATFRFYVQHPGERSPTPMTFMVEPPARTDIGERRNTPLVLRYLEEQGVKLR